MSKPKNKPGRGQTLESFLKEEGIFEEVKERAEKEILAWKLQEAMKEKKISVSALARKMKTSRTAVNRILDPKNSSITLGTLRKTANALGKRWRFELVEA